ncbi:flagellar biosynthetic protein FliR [Algiphilus sp.]|uniref:flagellar biosynthetic protein FliR n=1 Tax=Algiphilus sp. TaxID=1872431 RepID=UPI003B52BECC
MNGGVLALETLGQVYHMVLWPLLRTTSFVAIAPILGGRGVPNRIRLTVAMGLTILLVAVLPEPPPLEVFTAHWWLTALQQVVIGLAIGFIFLFAFEAVALGAEAISAASGLSFAQITDPLRGTSSGVLASFMTVIVMLIFLAMDGHLRLIDALATSFRLFPVGSELPSGAQLMVWLTFSAIIFTGAAQVALPVLTALLAANLALGLVSRAAPALNLFAIGFPATLLLVLLAMWAWLPAITEPLGALFNETIAVAKQGA